MPDEIENATNPNIGPVPEQAALTGSRFARRCLPLKLPFNFAKNGIQPGGDVVDLAEAEVTLNDALNKVINSAMERNRIIRKNRQTRRLNKESDGTTRPDELPDVPPIAGRMPPGTGKSFLIQQRVMDVAKAGLPVLIVARNHAAADEYEEAGARHYHGRQKEGGNFPEATCYRMDDVLEITGQNHRPLPSLCRNKCQHGQKWALDEANSTLDRKPEDSRAHERFDKAWAWFEDNKVDPEKVAPCRWLTHLRTCQAASVLVIPQQSFSESMAVLRDGDDGCDAVDRLVIVDESAPICEKLQVRTEDAAKWASIAHVLMRRVRGLLAAVEATAAKTGGVRRVLIDDDHPFPDPDAPRQFREEDDGTQAEIDKYKTQIEALEYAIEVCEVTAESLGRLATREGTQSVPDDLVERMEDIKQKTAKLDWSGGTAVWELISFEGIRLSSIPLRAAGAIVSTLASGGGYVVGGKLHVFQQTALGESLIKSKRQILWLDATLPAAVEAVIRAKGGEIVDILLEQNIRIVRHITRMFGRGRGRDEGDGSGESEEQRRYCRRMRMIALDAARALPRDRPRALLTHKLWLKPWYAEADTTDLEIDAGNFVPRSVLDILRQQDILVGHFGKDDRQHNDWSGFHLAIVGGQILRTEQFCQTYEADRTIALQADADPEDWPAWTDPPPKSKREVTCMVDEGSGIEVPCRLPMPENQKIRDWILKCAEETTVQAIGRVRGVRQFKKGDGSVAEPVEVHIYGGLPLPSLARYGLVVETYAEDPGGWQTIDRWNRAQRVNADARFESALDAVLGEGKKPTVRSIAAVMQAGGGTRMSMTSLTARLRAWRNRPENHFATPSLPILNSKGVAKPETRESSACQTAEAGGFPGTEGESRLVPSAFGSPITVNPSDGLTADVDLSAYRPAMADFGVLGKIRLYPNAQAQAILDHLGFHVDAAKPRTSASIESLLNGDYVIPGFEGLFKRAKS